jgi:hypothetical protein
MDPNDRIDKISNRNLIIAKSRVLNEVIESLLGGTTDITDYTYVFQEIEGLLDEGVLSTKLHETVYNLYCDEDFRKTDSSEIDSLCEEILLIDSAIEENYDSAERYFDEPVANPFSELHELNGGQLCEMINSWIKRKEENESDYFWGLLVNIRKEQDRKKLLIGKIEDHVAPLQNLAEQLLEVDDEEINYWAGNLEEIAYAKIDYPGVQNLSAIKDNFMRELGETLTPHELILLEKFFDSINNVLY